MVRAHGPLIVSVLMIALGMAGLAKAVAEGDAEFYLVLIFPVITGTGATFYGGTVLFLVGILMFFMFFPSWSAWTAERYAPLQGEVPQQRQPAPRGGTGFGGVIFLGPVPIVFGKGHFTRRLMLVAAIVMGLLLLAFIVGLLL